MREENQADAELKPLYTQAQLSKYQTLIRQATRWLFAGDVTERVDAAANADDGFNAVMPKKRKASKTSEKDLAVIIIDALSYHDGWVTEEKLAKKLNLGGKQVRKMLQFLGKQGFVVREHRRERKQGNKVESVAEQETMVAETRQATYVCIDYPHFYDMLRLRLYLAKQRASQRIDGGEAIEPYACCSRDGIEPVCGRKYTTMDMFALEMSDDGFYLCDACDNGIVAPDDVLSQQEQTGIARIKRARYRRENARLQRNALVTAVKPLEEQIAALENVAPPDFGSFTDWAARRQSQLRSGKMTAKEASGRSGKGGHLDYGIDGPLTGDVGVNVELNLGTEEAAVGTVVSTEAAPDPNASLPYFMQQAGTSGVGPSHAATAEPAEASNAADDELQQQYLAEFERQYKQHLEKMAAENLVAKEEKPDVKQQAVSDDDAHGDTAAQGTAEGGDMEWEDADDGEWEDA